MKERYKIQLFSHFNPYTYRNQEAFLWISNKCLEKRIRQIENNVLNTNLLTTSYKYDKYEDLDLFTANMWKSKLTKIGVNCEIVKIDYKE